MLITKGLPYGEVRGKLLCTPEQALELFDFVMKPGATGVIIRKYTYLDDNRKKKTGLFVSNYTPPTNPKTKKQQKNREKMHAAVLHWQWLPEAEKDKYRKRAEQKQMSGFNLHNSEFLNKAKEVPTA